jgi:hypothetical protein
MALRELHPFLSPSNYSAMSVLPGENSAQFKKFREDLSDEYSPVGLSKIEQVGNIAGLMWRKKYLVTYRRARLARRYRNEVVDQRLGRSSPVGPLLTKEDAAQARRDEQTVETAEREVRKDLGPDSVLLDLEEVVSFETLTKELDVHERLDGMIARAIKQLVVTKGMKEVAGLGPSTQMLRLPKPAMSGAVPEPAGIAASMSVMRK